MNTSMSKSKKQNKSFQKKCTPQDRHFSLISLAQGKYLSSKRRVCRLNLISFFKQLSFHEHVFRFCIARHFLHHFLPQMAKKISTYRPPTAADTRPPLFFAPPRAFKIAWWYPDGQGWELQGELKLRPEDMIDLPTMMAMSHCWFRRRLARDRSFRKYKDTVRINQLAWLCWTSLRIRLVSRFAMLSILRIVYRLTIVEHTCSAMLFSRTGLLNSSAQKSDLICPRCTTGLVSKFLWASTLRKVIIARATWSYARAWWITLSDKPLDFDLPSSDSLLVDRAWKDRKQNRNKS